MSKVFISYRRADPDERLAGYIQSELAKEGHSVFRDVDTRIGQRWAEEIQKELNSCDYFVILISEQSMDRDMVRQELQQVHELNKAREKPVILPVRMNYKGGLPYDMAAWLDPLQYTLWENSSDDARIAQQLVKVITGTSPLPYSKKRTLAEQQELIRSTEEKGLPLPKAELVLDILALVPDNPFYVKREVDDFFYNSLRWDNGVATLRAPRQMGKSSLLTRVRSRLDREGLKSVFIDLKLLAAETISDVAEAFEGIAYLITDQLGLTDDPSIFFKERGFIGTKLQKFLAKIVTLFDGRVVLLFDDIDSIFLASYCDAFFGSLRYVIDQKALFPALQQVGFAFALSYDPGLWIKSSTQSPFNVAKTFLLPEFNRKECHWLHGQHGSPLVSDDAMSLYTILGGHPYLTRLALYRISAKEMTFADIKREAATDEGIFGDHLRSRLWSVINGGLTKPLKTILDGGRCSNIREFQSLLAMGLVKGKNHGNASARFKLYDDYFKPRLDA